MDGNSTPRPSLESKYELLYRLMVIAAIAVIMVSLVGIASVTGLLSRVSDSRPNIETIPDKRGNDTERPGAAQPDEKHPPQRQRAPLQSARGIASCGDCGGSEPRFPKSVLQIDLITNRT